MAEESKSSVLVFNASDSVAGATEKLKGALGPKYDVQIAGQQEDAMMAIMVRNPDVVVVVGDPRDSNTSQTLAALATNAQKPVLLVNAAKAQQGDDALERMEASQMTGTQDVGQLRLAKLKALQSAGVRPLGIPLDMDTGVRAAVAAIEETVKSHGLPPR